MGKPLLSICIPTFNRYNYLQKTIQSIITQQDFLDGTAEIVICDNASTDDTISLCYDYMRKFPNFHYYRNDCNIGNKNFPLVLSKADGILRKLSNDTYMLHKDSLSFLCNVAKKYKETKPLIFFTNNNRPDSSKEMLSFNQFVVQAGYMITWLAGFSIWDEDCIGLEGDTDGCEQLLWQVRKAYELANKKNACIIFDERIGGIQPVKNKDMSYGLHKVFYQNYLNFVKPYVNCGALSSQEYEIIRKDLLYNFFTEVIINWEINREQIVYSEQENLKELVFNEYKDELYWPEYKALYDKQLIRKKIKRIWKKIIRDE